MRRALRLLTVAFVLGSTGVGCTSTERELQVGVKAFTEQRILGHAVAQLIEQRLGRRARVIECVDTFGCHQAIKRGEIDVLVEYTGTAALYSGRSFVAPAAAPPPSGLDGGAAGAAADAGVLAPVRLVARDRATTLEALEEAYAPDGLRWITKLGFGNEYRVVVTKARAQADRLSAIGDLEREGRIRVACPPSFLSRPGDGLGQLLRRHGLRLMGAPALRPDAAGVAQALRRGAADVGILYATDPSLDDRQLHALVDAEGFFPSYEAAILARGATLDQVPGLEAALASLGGTVDEERMRSLNRRVEVAGWTPADVGRELAQSMAKHAPDAGAADGVGASRPAVVIAARPPAPGGAPEKAAQERAIRGVRAAFPGRPVEVVEVRRPARAVHQGRARLAILGAEELFRRGRRGLTRDRRLEAVAVAGTRTVHVLVAKGKPSSPNPASARFAIEEKKGALAAARVLGVEPASASVASRADVLAMLAQGKTDAAIVYGPTGADDVDQAIASGARLAPAKVAGTLEDAPWLRPHRIPAKTYRGQTKPIDTLSAQVVLCGPARARAATGGGPVSAVPERSPPLTVAEVRAVARGTGGLEAPDPSLPGPWTAGASASQPPRWLPALDTALNLFALLFLGWLAVLAFGRAGDPPSSTSKDELGANRRNP